MEFERITKNRDELVYFWIIILYTIATVIVEVDMDTYTGA